MSDTLSIFLNASLVVVTAIYAFLTWKIASKTAEGAAASERSAESSMKSARAALHAAEIAEAALVVEFDTNLFRRNSDHSYFVVSCSPRAANVFVHGATIRPMGAEVDPHGKLVKPHPLDDEVLVLKEGADCGELPAHLHAGEAASFEWHLGVDNPASFEVGGKLLVSYSLTGTSLVHQTSSPIQTVDGVNSDLMNAEKRRKL